MAERLTPTAIFALEQLAAVKPNHAPPPIDFTVAAELVQRGYAVTTGLGGLEITEGGRTFLDCYHAGKT